MESNINYPRIHYIFYCIQFKNYYISFKQYGITSIYYQYGTPSKYGRISLIRQISGFNQQNFIDIT